MRRLVDPMNALANKIADEQQPIDMAAYLRRRRDALLQEVRAIEDLLGIEPQVRAVCPSCQTKWSKKAG